MGTLTSRTLCPDGAYGPSLKKRRQVACPAATWRPSPRGPADYRKNVPVAKIAGPSYYTYKTDALRRVDWDR